MRTRYLSDCVSYYHAIRVIRSTARRYELDGRLDDPDPSRIGTLAQEHRCIDVWLSLPVELRQRHPDAWRLVRSLVLSSAKGAR